ncbi:MAG TPA: acyl-ACP--UDP-N-acetylglucosamine O-acyltransferase [Gemmataceae bacterium]|jgi:UDP-N-acetylglucosamine acyltransferase
MPIAQSARVHPTAVIAPEADLGDEVQVGPYVVIEGEVRVGSGCVLRPGAHLIGPLTMGCHNTVYGGAVLGEQPQHLKYAGEPTRLVIGDHNIIREHVTVHRGTTHSWETRLGNHNFLMAHSHVAHDCRIGNHCILANSALVAGHCVLEDNVYLSGNSAIHQFCRVGRLALLGGISAATKDIPPFIIQHRLDRVVGVNVVGMRRAGIPTAHIDAVRRAFHLLYRSQMVVPAALAHMERDLGGVPEVAEMIAFIRASTRGIILHMDREAAA